MLQLETLSQWLADTKLNDFIISNSYVWPSLESLHFIGLSLLFGAMLLVDLSALGLMGNVAYQGLKKFVGVAVIGFSINLLTGVGFVIGDPSRYFANPAFALKMLCVGLALFNACYFANKVKKLATEVLPVSLKISAGLSLCLWLAVMVLGRFMPYVE